MSERGVWMAGPARSAKGGMSAVVAAYEAAGLFSRWRLRYLDTYTRPGALNQLRVFGAAWLALLGGLLRGRVALLHLHSASRGSFWRKSLLAAVAGMAGVPYVFHVHSGEFAQWWRGRGAVGRWWVCRTLERARAVLVLTPGWVQTLQAGAPAARWRVARNPVEVPAACPQRAGLRERWLFLGRLRESKGANDLLAALPAVLARHPGVRLTMAGDGDVPAMQALAQRLGVADAVHFTGWIDGGAKDRALAEHGVMVLPSHAEGLPLTILEAMAQGLAVVATQVGGIPELVRDGHSAWLVPARDPAALSEALLALLEQPGACEQRVAQAFADVKAYALPQVVAEMDALYAEWMGAKR